MGMRLNYELKRLKVFIVFKTQDGWDKRIKLKFNKLNKNENE